MYMRCDLANSLRNLMRLQNPCSAARMGKFCRPSLLLHANECNALIVTLHSSEGQNECKIQRIPGQTAHS